MAVLDELRSPVTVSTCGARSFGFVIGGVLPTALAAIWLAGAWDQNAALRVMSPTAARLEEIVIECKLTVLGLPKGSGAGPVTGTTAANFTGLARGGGRARCGRGPGSRSRHWISSAAHAFG